MKNYELILWDWNGTLLNDVWLSVKSINSVLLSRKLPEIDEIKYCEVFGFPVKDYYERIGFDFATDPFEVVGTEFINHYNATIFSCKLQENALDILDFFKKNGFKQAILSARKEEQLKDDIHFYGISQFLDDFSGLADHYAASKLENGRKLIQKLSTNSTKVLLIGDTLHDAEVADSLGIDCILFEGGHQSREVLKSANKKIIKSLTELKF